MRRASGRAGGTSKVSGPRGRPLTVPDLLRRHPGRSRHQVFTEREARWMPTFRFTRWSALSTVLVSHSSRSPITS